MRFYLALYIAKFAQLILKLLSRNATYFAGKLAIKVCPDFLGAANKPKTIIGVTGTNGKTTVVNLIVDALEGMGVKVLSNRFGSNVNAGVATALINGLTLTGRQRYNTAVLELDERSSRLIFPYIKPVILVVTNLFRDSMRRNAHPYFIADLLTEHISKDTKLILNADDLISSQIAPENQRVYFSLPHIAGEPEPRESIVFDAHLCPLCSAVLIYDFKRYNHIGRAHCPACTFVSPDAEYKITSVDFENLTALFEGRGTSFEIPLGSEMLHNAYNSLCAIAALFEAGYEASAICTTMSEVKITGTRLSASSAGRWYLSLIMAKGLNAVACSRSFDYAGSKTGRNAVILMLDDVFDEKKSSENVAWLYDADFEFLCSENVIQIITVGKRAPDSLLRLLIAGVPREKIHALDCEDSVAAALNLDSCDNVFILYELYRYDKARRLGENIAELMRSER